MSKRNSAIADASSLTIFAEEAYELKMLGREKPDLSRIYYAPLNVLQEKDLPIVE
ncbi:MAG: hypothetical protein HMLIMOIP_001138 [Candidatus Nitrosomirales archaeon]|jgi:hypothetical protein